MPWREGQQAHAQVLHPHPLGHGEADRQLVLERVEQRLVVVGLDVVDELLRVGGVAGAAGRCSRPGCRRRGGAVAVHDHVGGQVAGHAAADPVLLQQQPGLLVARRPLVGGVGVGVEAGQEALLLDAAERAAAPRGVAEAVVEGADAGARPCWAGWR